jgi:hypothetical protein
MAGWGLGTISQRDTAVFIRLGGSANYVTTSDRTLSVFIGEITFSNQAYKKSLRAEGVRL